MSSLSVSRHFFAQAYKFSNLFLAVINLCQVSCFTLFRSHKTRNGIYRLTVWLRSEEMFVQIEGARAIAQML